MLRRLTLLAVAAVVAAAGASLLVAAPASAVYIPGPGPVQDPSAESELTLVGTRLPGSVEGTFNGIPQNPTSYPAATGTPYAEGTALIRLQNANGTGPIVEAYCVNLVTNTYVGVRYESSDWSTGGVANSAYIQYILTAYYPQTSLPGSVSDTDKVRAVQAAIWFFSDGYVLTNSDFPARERTRLIVEAAIAAVQGPNPPTPPAPPSLSITPPTASVPSDAPAGGPFTVSFSGATTPVTVEQVTGLQLYADAARTIPVPVNTVVTNGQQLWVGGATAGATFALGAQYTVVAGTLYTADPNPAQFQKIVLAQTSTLPVRASASITTYDANSVTITKTISGDRAGRQGEIALEVTCDTAPAAGVTTKVTIPAGSPAGTYTRTISSLRSGATCSVTETSSGANGDATLSASSITPASFTVPGAGAPAATVAVSDAYANPHPILPVTGAADATGPALLGAGLLAAGALLVALRRRSRA